MNWFYAIGQQRHGPVSQMEFLRLVREGGIGPDTLVWRQGMENWRRYGDLTPEDLGTAGTTAVAEAEAAAVDDGETEVCAHSGRRYPRSRMFPCGDGRWVASEHREAFFSSVRGEGPAAGEMEYAGFWIRVLAKLIDGVVLWLVGMIKEAILAFAFFGSLNFLQPGAGAGMQAGTIIAYYAVSLSLGVAIGLGYTWYFLSRYEATPGKMALDLKVVRPDGSRLSNGQIVGRYFAEMLSSLILCIGYLMVAFDRKEHKALHDVICETRVIRKR